MHQSSHVADTAPSEPTLTGYDMEHLVVYLRLLDAEADGADWREVAQIVLEADPAQEPERAKRMWASHLVGRHLGSAGQDLRAGLLHAVRNGGIAE
jgi:hypothetical protein